MIFNLLTCDNNDGELVAGDVNELVCVDWLFVIADANFLLLSSVVFDKNEGDRLRFNVDEDVRWRWSSNDESRGGATGVDVDDDDDDVSLTSRTDAAAAAAAAAVDDDDAAAAAARKNGWDKAAAAAIAAWLGSTEKMSIE